MRLGLFLFAAFFLFTSRAHAEDTTVIPFQSPSSIGVNLRSPRSALFEGAVFPHFFIVKSKKVTGDAENAHRWSLLFTPGFRFRLRRERTEPAGSPSYLPRIDFQKLRINDHGSIVNVWEWHAGVGHHSNGELSTNDIRGGINFRRNLVDKDGQTTRDLSAGIGYQRQFGTSSSLKSVYAKNRVSGTLAMAWKDLPWTSRLGTEMTVSVAVDHPLKQVARWSFTPGVAWHPWSQSGLGLYARLYRGEDYYNLHFAGNIPHRVQIGVEFEQDGFLKFKPR